MNVKCASLEQPKINVPVFEITNGLMHHFVMDSPFIPAWALARNIILHLTIPSANQKAFICRCKTQTSSFRKSFIIVTFIDSYSISQ